MGRETKTEEHARLLKRTKALQKEHNALNAPPLSPEDEVKHEQHRADLTKHSDDLLRHKKRR